MGGLFEKDGIEVLASYRLLLFPRPPFCARIGGGRHNLSPLVCFIFAPLKPVKPAFPFSMAGLFKNKRSSLVRSGTKDDRFFRNAVNLLAHQQCRDTGASCGFCQIAIRVPVSENIFACVRSSLSMEDQRRYNSPRRRTACRSQIGCACSFM